MQILDQRDVVSDLTTFVGALGAAAAPTGAPADLGRDGERDVLRDLTRRTA